MKEERDSQSPIAKLLDDAMSGRLVEQRPSKAPTKKQVEAERRYELLRGLAELAEHGPWVGTASDLMERFDQRFATNGYRRPPRWPKRPAGLAILCRRYYADAVAHGLDLDFFHDEEVGSRRAVYKISRSGAD